MITVVVAPPFATVQDCGRTGYRDSGVPVSGIADRNSGVVLNSLLGNDPTAAMIEWAVAGGVLRFECNATVAIGGADAIGSVNGTLLRAWTAVDVSPGGEIRVERIVRGRFLLIAVRGGIDVPMVLGSRSTLLSAAMGGFNGRRLRDGDCLAIGQSPLGSVDRSTVLPHALERRGAIHVMRGPQAELFGDAAWATFLGAEFAVSRASDRTGYRLEGVTLKHHGLASLPSEPTCIGAIQVPDGGEPIVIMADGPTVGGYPKMAVVRSADLSRFAQLVPGEKVRFVLDT